MRIPIYLTLACSLLSSSSAFVRRGRPLGDFEASSVEFEGRSTQQVQPQAENPLNLLDKKLAQQLQAFILERQSGQNDPTDPPNNDDPTDPSNDDPTDPSNSDPTGQPNDDDTITQSIGNEDNETNEDTEDDMGNNNNNNNSPTSAVLTINPQVVPEGWTCVNKVMMVEDVEYADELHCTHILEESCHETYETVFKTEEVEECKEKFIKNCYIEYHAVPRTQKIEVCQQPYVRNCAAVGDEVCSNEYETVCETTYHENEVEDEIAQCVSNTEEVCNDNGKCTNVPKQVCNVMKMNSTKLTPETDCRQEVREVCGPEACPLVQGPRVCANEIKTFVQDVPEEVCHLNPQRTCNPTNKIIPKLEQRVKCIDVPREVCNTVQVEAKKITRPAIKKWCGILPESATESEDVTETAEEAQVETTESQSLIDDNDDDDDDDDDDDVSNSTDSNRDDNDSNLDN